MPGRAADGTWAAGARRTIDADADRLWEEFVGPAGLGRWLAIPAPARALAEGDELRLADGTVLRAIRVRPPAQLRLRLDRAAWPHPRTAQLRLIPAATGVTVALHLEGLPDEAARRAAVARWREFLAGRHPLVGPERRPRASAPRPAAARIASVRPG
jgi:uncharacterized protein YndB with AHSA1/START domain